MVLHSEEPEDAIELTAPASMEEPSPPLEAIDARRWSRGLLAQCFGNRWAMPILCELYQEPLRSAKLKRTLAPISQRMMTLSLRKLEREGLVWRREQAGQPPQVTYGLTTLGKTLREHLSEIERRLSNGRAQGLTMDQND